MPVDLSENECRVLGSLVEKQLTTPEYYPLTLNALIAACNQKSNREPVMALDETAVLASIDSLRERNLVYLYYGSTSRAVKYKHMLPSVYELDDAGVAVLALLFLRGPQTLGELRGRSGRMHEFASLGDVQETLDNLATRDEPLVAKLPRAAGQKDARYAHLLSGTPSSDAAAAEQVSPAVKGDRIAQLEAEVAGLRSELEELKTSFAAFRTEFE
jgi:uncharacterized protein YceH (UPF0502 family)